MKRLLIVTTIAVAAYVVGRARAGVPSVTQLFYAGTLEDNSGPLGGMHAVTVRLWDAASGGNALCAEGPVGSTLVTAGRFRVALDASCVAAVHTNTETFIEVKVDSTTLPRSKVGAVPYALEAASVPWSGVTGVPSTAQTLTLGGKSYSLGAKYCGSTASVTPGGAQLNSYTTAKSLCEAACSAPTAHMCSGEELLRFAQLGGTLPANGWYSDAEVAYKDCTGWTSTNYSGPTWIASPSGPGGDSCTSSHPVLCCN
jgi:hypothetical protein